MVPAIWNYLVGYVVGTAIAVIGLYIAFVLPVFLRYRLRRPLRAGRVEPRRALQVDRPARDPLGRVHHDPLPFPVSPGGVPFKSDPGFSWDVVNYAPATVGGALILFGGWWLLSARNWFKGPVAMGTEEELEQLEAEAELQPVRESGLTTFICCGSDEGRRQRRPSSFSHHGCGYGWRSAGRPGSGERRRPR